MGHQPSCRRHFETIRLAWVVALFAGLTVLMTWPLVTVLEDGVRDPGDPLFNAWVLAWDVHQLRQGAVFDLFDANIFYPHHRTLAYSEHLLPQALLTAPVLLATENPVLAHNLALLFGFLTSALAMYALARYLTGSRFGAVVAGMLFAWSPFMLSHLSHLQVIWAAGLPLSFYFLERLLAERRWRDALLLALVAALQILANGYYALFLCFFATLYVAIELVRRQALRNRRLVAQLAVAGLVVTTLTAPFLAQYVLVQREMRFKRSIDYGAKLENLLAAPPINRLYGELTEPLRAPERAFFPTLTGAALAVAGGLTLRRSAKASAATQRRQLRLPARRLLRWLLAAVGVLFVLRRFDIGLHLELRGDSSEELFSLLFFLLAAYALVNRWEARTVDHGALGSLPTYLFLGGLALVFTLGEAGPYPLLHDHVPGFDGIRAIPRFYVVTLLVLALFAARGGQWLLERWPRRRLAFLGLVPLGLVLELASFPIPLSHVAVDDEVPPVYRWLATVGRADDPVLEVPFGVDEIHRVYFSSVHWKPLANGYSGYFPPLYAELERRWRELSLEQNLADARLLGVRYLVVHTNQPQPGAFAGLAAALDGMPEEVRPLRRFADGVHVYELDGPASLPFANRGEPLSREGWTATASTNAKAAPRAFDGKLRTRWDSDAPQQPGTVFELDLGRVEVASGVGLALGPNPTDYPRGYEILASRDGAGDTWELATRGTLDDIPITTFLTPRDLVVPILFPPRPVRRLRLIQTGRTESVFWSINELEVLGAGGGRPAGVESVEFHPRQERY